MRAEFVRREEYKEEIYLNSAINAWRDVYLEYDIKKDDMVEKKYIMCHLYRDGSKNQPLNLGECSNGDKFTSVNQAVNDAKFIAKYLNSLIL